MTKTLHIDTAFSKGRRTTASRSFTVDEANVLVSAIQLYFRDAAKLGAVIPAAATSIMSTGWTIDEK